MTDALTREEAEALWDDLVQAFADVEDALVRIIATKAWKPLGYDSFATAFRERMADVPLSRAVSGHVLYQMFREGTSDIEAALAVRGVGPTHVRQAREAMVNGVPANQAITVRQHERHKGTPEYRHVNLKLKVAEYAEWEKLCKKNKTSLQHEIEALVRSHFDVMKVATK